MAQQLERYQAVTAYLYKFAENVKWTNEDSLKEFSFLIIGNDKELIHEMAALSKTKLLKNKPVIVNSSISVDNLYNAQLIFVTKEYEKRIPELFDKIEGKFILLVSDNYQDKRLIMINFVESENKNSLLFEINKANILNQHLTIMPDIILLGGTEIDVAALYRMGQRSLKTLQKSIQNIRNNLSRMEASLEEKTKEGLVQKDSLVKQAQKILEQQKILSSQSDELKKQEDELATKIRQINEQQEVYAYQAQKLKEQTQELSIQKKEFDIGSELLKNQEEKLEKQKSEIATQSKILKEKGATINKQQGILYFLIIIVFLVIILLVSIYLGYKTNKRLNKELERKVKERTDELQTANGQLLIELAERNQAELALKENMLKFRTLFETNPDAIFITDALTIEIIDCNDVACTMNGYTREELVGKSINILHLEETAKTVDEMEGRIKFIEYLKNNKSITTESFHKRKDGSLFQIETSMCLLTLGNRLCVMGIDRDISERKKAEQELERYRKDLEEMVRERTNNLRVANEQLGAIFQATDIGIVVISDRIIRQCNSKLEKIFGYEPGELIGKKTDVWYLTGDDFSATGKIIYEPVWRGETYQSEMQFKRKNGEVFWARLSIRALDPADPVKGVVSVIEDVTIERENENSLKKALEAAKAADYLKSAFLATMSHELRTPLNSIIGFTGILLKGIAGTLNNEQAKQLGMAKQSAHHLLELINDVLDISKIEAGELVVAKHKFNLRDLLQKVVASVQPLAEKKDLILFLDISNDVNEIYSDERRVSQIFLNLINNAIKFTDRGFIKIECKSEGNFITAKVIDTGIGINEKDMEKLFKPFSQIDTGLTRNREGTGLGLSISNKLTEKLGGSITVESTVGIGSTFIVRLPVEDLEKV